MTDDIKTKQIDPLALSEALRLRFENAKKRRGNWESLWQQAYDFALPQRGGFTRATMDGGRKTDQIFDATAADAVDQLSASLLGNLTPPWTNWFGLKPGPDLSAAESEALAPILEQAAKTIQSHFDRSNFSVEVHQCYLDLVTGGTASLYFEETEPGSFSAFRFNAVPLSDIVLEEGESGMLDASFRTSKMTLAQLSGRFGVNNLPQDIVDQGLKDTQQRFNVLEGVMPDGLVFRYTALLMEGGDQGLLLKTQMLQQSPFINFRWLKSPGEIYGRSPVIKALPDIKTANKVVELILKNASISVTGIWQADDDGILNPANISLVPGTIIPKAVGSRGLQPLEMPARFDVSQLVLEDLRDRIRHALLADRLPVVGQRTMTATEVLERSAQMAMVLGATYGRLQNELLTPLVVRAFNILRRRGEVPDVRLDGRMVELDYRSPLARAQGQRNVQNTLSWIQSVLAMGGEASAAINFPAAARFLGEAMGVPSDLIRNEQALQELLTTQPTGQEEQNAETVEA